MNPFVNFNKRGMGLPPGCKDLADVLAHQSIPPARMEQFTQVAVKAVEGQILQFYQGNEGVMQLTPPLGNASAILSHGPGTVYLYYFRLEAARWHHEEALHQMFSQAGLKLHKRSELSLNGCNQRAFTYSLPQDAYEAALLVAQSLRLIFEVTDYSLLSIHVAGSSLG